MSAIPSYLDTLPARQAPAADNVATLDWRAGLRRRGENFVGDELNVLTALRACPDFARLVRFNEFAQRIEFARAPAWRDAKPGSEWTERDDLDAQVLLQRYSIDVRNRGVVADALARVAHDAAYHPVREYLRELEWDGTPRLATWLATHCNATSPQPSYLAAVGTRFLVSAVARVRRPGCQVDHALVLESGQGFGKSTAVRVLGEPWTTDSLPDLSDKDSMLQLAGAWIVELPELAALRRSEVEHIKAFLSRRVDRFRPPYARRDIEVPRQSVFIATTNEAHYLRDSTGNRRFWPVRCGRIDTDALAEARPQLWAEATALFDAGEQWHLTPEEAMHAAAEQSDRELVTELETLVGEYLERMLLQGQTEVTVRQVMRDAIGIDPSEDVERAGRVGPQVAAAMHRLGWYRARTVGRSPNRRTLYRYPQPENSQGFIGVEPTPLHARAHRRAP